MRALIHQINFSVYNKYTSSIHLIMKTIFLLAFIVPTNYGDVLGVETDMAQIFYGIPFAQPPLDQLRYILDRNHYYYFT